MAPASKGKSQTDHVEAFNDLAAAYKARQSDKLLSEMDKVLAVLGKVSDVSVFEPGRQEGLALLLHCSHLLQCLEARSSTVWAIVSLLASLATASPALAAFLSGRLALLPTLARLLHAGPAAGRAARLLELLQPVAAAGRVLRREAHLTALLADLAGLATDHSSPLAGPALRVLCSITRGSHPAAKALLVTLPLERLTTTTFAETADQVSAEYLCLNLRRVRLAAAGPSEPKVKSFLVKLTDVFCAALSSEGLPTMRLLVAFLADMRGAAEYREVLAAQDATLQVQQLLASIDFTGGFKHNVADVFFEFLTELVSAYQAERVVLFEPAVKVVLGRLEARPGQGRASDRAASALGLVHALLEETDMHALSEPERGILRFQLDHLLPSLLALALECRPAKEPGATVSGEALTSCLACLRLLQLVAGVQEWRAATGQLVPAAKLASAYRAVLAGLPEERQRAALATEFLTLAGRLQEDCQPWRRARDEALAEEAGALRLVASVLRREGEPDDRTRKALDILKAADYSMVEELHQGEQPVEEREEAAVMSAEQSLRIDQMLETVTESLGRAELEPVLAEVLELAAAGRGQERQEAESLRQALAGADLQLQATGQALASRQQRAGALERQVGGLVASLGAARGELADLRGQHGVLAREADSTRDKLGRELADRKADIEQMEEEKRELEAAVAKCKETMGEQKVSLKQLAENEKVLTTELKKEMRLKEEKDMKLKKGEEKLKKKERQLEDELCARERAEKEVSLKLRLMT
jgi:hypothetical protein